MDYEKILRAIAEMQMPERGVGTAWPTEYCPFECGWTGKPDECVPAEKQGHEPTCPITIAKSGAYTRKAHE
jgi:hypothetical protein